MQMIQTQGLCKTYKSSGVKALDNVSLGAKKGIFALLGRNGAGKTTLVRILATQLTPTSGQAKVLGFDVMENAKELRKRIAVIPQEASPIPQQTPKELIYFYARLRGLGRNHAGKETERIINRLGLSSHRKIPCANLSGGLRRAVLLGMTLISKADIYFLDEPTIGLDPLARRRIWKFIREISANGKTVFLTTHYMEEAQVLADELAIIDHGKIVASGAPQEIIKVAGTRFRVTFEGEDIPDEILSYGEVAKTENGVLLYVKNAQDVASLVQLCIKQAVRFSMREVNLEDAFIKLVGTEDHAEVLE